LRIARIARQPARANRPPAAFPLSHSRKQVQMTDLKNRELIKLGDTDLTVANPDEDIRGRSVVDSAGEKIGEVDALLIDDTSVKVRFMDVASGGFLGIGDKHVLIPVDAITRIDKDNVYINQTGERIKGAPEYDPNLVSDNYYSDLYGYYGYTPYWMSGYAYPAYPYYM
jgi:sporulation protein YlmC with PRC-barrel domain